MYVDAAVYDIQTLTQVGIQEENIKKGLNLAKNIEPLAILSFGYSK
jgi:hypothetical protein